uniref:MAM domain-containing protein n=1 Tax=Mesocestoides corti TaxID=53468 RepID=A0A5K3EU25_MESCO
MLFCVYNSDKAGKWKTQISENTSAWVIGNATRQIRQCLSKHVCSGKSKFFRIAGRDNGAWEGRILSSTASSLPGISPVYSLELTKNELILIFQECIVMDNVEKTKVILAPIRITNFRMQLNVQRVSANEYTISNSRDIFSDVIAYKVNPKYPEARAIYRSLKFFFDSFC